MSARWGYEIRTRDGWSADAAGVQDASNTFATREEAEQYVQGLADVLGIDASDVRVADLGA